MLVDEQHDSKLDLLLTEIIDNLVDGNSTTAAEGFVELARYYARAGMPQSAFNGMRKYCVGSAINKTGSPGFIKATLEQAEQKNLKRRTEHSINNIVKH